MSARAEALIQDVQAERKITAKVIRGIYEVNLHKDYLAYNCDSMYQFCRIVLGYDGSAAWRRMEAAALLAKVPEVAEQIESGALSLTNVATINRIQEKAKKSDVEIPAAKLIDLAMNTETRVAERRCLKLALEYGVDVDPEKRRYDSEIDDLLSALSHKHPGINKEALLRLAVHEMHEKYCAEKKSDIEAKVKNPAGRHVPAKLERAVHEEAERTCSWIDPKTKSRCESRHQLQIDHIVPIAKGGTTEAANLRLLCRFHNQQAAREAGLRRPFTSARKRYQAPQLAPHSLANSS